MLRRNPHRMTKTMRNPKVLDQQPDESRPRAISAAASMEYFNGEDRAISSEDP
jgi:hypothetical protein